MREVFTLQNDAETSTDPNYFAQKNEVTMQLYNMTQELAYLVYELDVLLEKVTNKRTKGKLQALKRKHW